MKKEITVLILALAFGNAAHAHVNEFSAYPFDTANNFIALCNGGEVEKAMCVSYLVGFGKGMAAASVVPNLEYKTVKISPLTMIREIKKEINNNSRSGDDATEVALVKEFVRAGIVRIKKQ